MKRIVFTGGGTAGHVTPNMALIECMQKEGYKAYYIGSKNGIEKKLISDMNVPYYEISTGKLRRYFDLKNVTDAFKVIKGLADAVSVLKKINPDLVFSKGGFVTVPVTLAAGILKIPVIIHESDITPGLANRICMPFSKEILVNFPETLKYTKGKGVLTGSPIRHFILNGKREEGLRFLGFNGIRPVVLFMGGSLGAKAINICVRDSLPSLLKLYDIIHLCGKGNVDLSINEEGYKQFEYINKELADVFAASDLIVSRAGASSICEFLALKKANILIPLPLSKSRGDQVLNAKSFSSQGFSKVLDEEHLTPDSLLKCINTVFAHKGRYVEQMGKSFQNDSTAKVINRIKKYL